MWAGRGDRDVEPRQTRRASFVSLGMTGDFLRTSSTSEKSAEHRRFSTDTHSSLHDARWCFPHSQTHESFLWKQFGRSFQSSNLFCSSAQPTLYYIYILYKYTAHEVWTFPYSPTQMVRVSRGVVRSFQQRPLCDFTGIWIKKVQSKTPGQIIWLCGDSFAIWILDSEGMNQKVIL